MRDRREGEKEEKERERERAKFHLLYRGKLKKEFLEMFKFYRKIVFHFFIVESFIS